MRPSVRPNMATTESEERRASSNLAPQRGQMFGLDSKAAPQCGQVKGAGWGKGAGFIGIAGTGLKPRLQLPHALPCRNVGAFRDGLKRRFPLVARLRHIIAAPTPQVTRAHFFYESAQRFQLFGRNVHAFSFAQNKTARPNVWPFQRWRKKGRRQRTKPTTPINRKGVPSSSLRMLSSPEAQRGEAAM